MSKKDLELNVSYAMNNNMPSSIVSLLLADAYSAGVISSDELIAYHNNNL